MPGRTGGAGRRPGPGRRHLDPFAPVPLADLPIPIYGGREINDAPERRTALRAGAFKTERPSMSDPLARIAALLAASGDPANPDPETLRELLESTRMVAVVGLSRNPAKAARRVPSYLAAKGMEVIPINPHADRILGRAANSTLDQVEEAVDLVLIFRPSEQAGSFVDQAARRPEEPAIWLQTGIQSPEAVARAREAGRIVVQDLCIFQVHRSLPQGAIPPP